MGLAWSWSGRSRSYRTGPYKPTTLRSHCLTRSRSRFHHRVDSRCWTRRLDRLASSAAPYVAKLLCFPLRKGGGRVDAPAGWLVGAKGESPLYRPSSPLSSPRERPLELLLEHALRGGPRSGMGAPRAGSKSSIRNLLRKSVRRHLHSSVDSRAPENWATHP